MTEPQPSDGYHHGDLRRALLRAVEEIVLERGAADVSLREAARRAGVSHSAPAHHFGDKDGLLAAFAQEGFQTLAGEMEEAARNAAGPGSSGAIGAAYVRFAIAHPAHYEVMFRSDLLKRGGAAFQKPADAAMQALLDMVERIQAAGHFTDRPATVVAAYFWSLVHGLASLWIDGRLPHMFPGMDAEDVIQSVLSPSFDAARPAEAPKD